MIRFQFHQQIVFILILLALQGRCFSHARQVKEVSVTVITTEKESAVEGDSNFSLQKDLQEILPNAAEIETSEKIGGRKMIVETTRKASKEQSRKIGKKLVSMASSSSSTSAVIPSVGNRQLGGKEEKWKDNFMVFTEDYHPPKPHPPKNN